MAKYEDLLDSLKDEKPVKTNWDEELPEQFGAGSPPPLPEARYQFALPTNLADAWEVFDANIDEEKVKRPRIVFDSSHPLTITRSKGGVHDGEVYQGRVQGNERNRARRGDPAHHASDLDYLLEFSFGDKSKPKTPAAYIKAINQYAGREFAADIEWSSSCNPNATRYITNENGASIEDPTGAPGCGNRYYSRDIPRDPTTGAKLERFICPNPNCGASLRSFGNLTRFGPASE